MDTPLQGRDKNTALEFEEDESLLISNDVASWKRSESTSSSPCPFKSSLSEDIWKCDGQRLQIHGFGNDFQHDVHTCTTTSDKPEREREESIRKGKKYMRPSKIKLYPLRNYVYSLKAQVEEDPQGFDCQKIGHPPNLIREEKLLEKVVSIVEKHRANVTSNFPMHASLPSAPLDSSNFSNWYSMSV